VRLGGEPDTLSTREFDLLQAFMLSANRVLSRELVFEAAEPCRIPGNQILLGLLVRNLVDNAVR
jgi:DNA-binding response OmpR family regulator